MDPAGYLTWLTLNWLTIVSSALGILLIVVVVVVLRSFSRYQFLRSRDMTWLELTPPSNMTRTPQATNELFNVIHGFHGSRSIGDKILNHPVIMSLEITSNREQGIRYLAQVESRHSETLKQTVTAYLPQIKVATIEAPLQERCKVTEFKQTGHYAFPLSAVDRLDQNDPAAYLTGAMTNLKPNESIHVQFVLEPVRIQEALSLARRILGNEDLLRRLNSRKLPLWDTFIDLINSIVMGTAELIGEMLSTAPSPKKSYSGSDRNTYNKIQVQKHEKPARTLSTFEQELMQTMHDKLNQPLFRTNLRVAVTMNDSDSTMQRLTAVKTALYAYSVPSYQTLTTRLSVQPFGTFKLRAFTYRMPSLRKKHTLTLASSELASLFHFPIGNTAQTDNLVTSLSRTLAAPISLKQDKHLDVLFGENFHHGVATPIGLTSDERERHMYIIGGTGNGKTTMLQYQIVQDMISGQGVAVVDPHGDMAETLLKHVPSERLKDVIYFNPDDLEFPIGLNLLELSPGLTGNELLREKDIITESVVSVFRKIFSEDDSGGHRIEYVLRNTVQTALTTENPTLFTVFDLLNDSDYRKKIIGKLEDKNLKNFWKNEIGKAGDMQKVKMSAGITAKIGRFLFSASAKQILEQPTSTIDFDEIINSGKILICNFSKGLLGEDTSELFGITVLAKLQLASLRRARIEHDERRPYYLYVDEFQNFATASFVQMLSEARKYRLFLTMAEQSTSQQDDQQMVSIILANVGTVICFRTGNPQDEKVLFPLFKPFIDEGEISNLPAFNFYAKLSAIKAQEPLSGHTLLLESEGSREVAQAVKALSQKAFAKNQTPRPAEPRAKTETATKQTPQFTSTEENKKDQAPGDDPLLVDIFDA